MATNYVLVDFENVQPDMSALAGTANRVIVFFGAKQQEGRVKASTMLALIRLGPNVEIVELLRSGKNALDMHIAFHIGRIFETEPDASVHIVSGDTDFDPLIEYLTAKGSSCRRVRSIAELAKYVPRTPAAPRSASRAAPPSPAKKAQSDRLAPIIKHLHSLRGKPSTRKTLVTTIASYFKQHGGALADKVVEQLIDELIRLKYVSQSGTKVAYHLS